MDNNNGQNVKKKSNAWKWILGIILAVVLVGGGLIFMLVAGIGVIAVGGTVNNNVEKSKYAKDIATFDQVSRAVKVFVADTDSEYSDGEYTLSELMLYDSDNIIAEELSEYIYAAGKAPYDVHCDSKAFEGTTTNDIVVTIQDYRVYVYVPVNWEYADDFEAYEN